MSLKSRLVSKAFHSQLINMQVSDDTNVSDNNLAPIFNMEVYDY